MNLLILCTKYSLEEGCSWLTDSLAEELVETHKVVVVCLDWSGQYKNDFHIVKNGVEVYVFSTQRKFFRGRFGKILKWFFSAASIAPSVRRIFKDFNFDLVVSFSPALIMKPLLKAYKKQGCLTYLILWDFFPIYDSEFGLIPKPLKPVLKFVENGAYNDYDRIGVMSPENLSFLKGNFKLRSETAAEVLSIWGPNNVMVRSSQKYMDARKSNDFCDDLICVFGGQLVRGRGIDKVIELAIYAKRQKISAKFYIFGDGPEREKILSDIIAYDVSDVVVYKGFKPRDEYIRFLVGADLGLVFNSGAAVVPTFPSKSIDYLRAAVPILAYVEDATDFGNILEGNIRAGWSASPSNNSKLFENFSAVAQMTREDLFLVGAQGQAWYLENMTVRKISSQLVLCRSVGHDEEDIKM
ncbi:glycosyltransferase [Pseudomonas cavernicola]|uniref:Glycosyltransferase n=1 Tax=Pseudomonas cavernicola TaxID=2320866 RepID=A0A418XA36_9PSED|nr:glycosyltransferase [Pseudomonas cavernicola]RJG09228.1 glycosyltransferase [Pseudomonas cavernicola]RJG09359.1 glycosyltransferase [Pseudomonas cavernicola]